MTPQAFSELSANLRTLLDSGMRPALVRTLASKDTMADALSALRRAMRSHVWTISGRSVPLTAAIQAADADTRREGFHALHDWDGIADDVNPEIIPVDVLDFVRACRPHDRPSAAALAILVDYYFFHLASLLALRVWDTPDPSAALGDVGTVLNALQGPEGSGQPFVADPETLLLIATSHYEPDEHGYDLLLDRVRALPRAQREAIALGHAASLGAHLRFGFLATYGRQTGEMRSDNVADYPWLIWSVEVAVDTIEDLSPDALAGPRGRQWTEALAGSLTADTDALLTHPSLGPRLRALLPRLMPALTALSPGDDAYTPLALFFNFSHNLIKGTVVDAVLRDAPWTVSYNDLLTGESGGRSPLTSRAALARVLMEYARRSPQRIRGELLPVIVYEPEAGRECHAAMMSVLRQLP